MKLCLECNKEFKGYDNRAKFCSRSCSAISTNRNRGPRSDSTKEKISNKLKQFSLKTKKIPLVQLIEQKYVILKSEPKTKTKNCIVCQQHFKTICSSKSRITCSTKCHKILSVKAYRKNKASGLFKKMGGLRDGAGRGKSGYYKGFFLNSTYELAYLMYCLDHNISIKRNLEGFKYFDPDRNNEYTFYPDFIVNDELIEIKGYKTKLNDYKLSGVNKPIRILYKSDLQDVFNYVTTTYHKSIENLYQLYDEFKPKYTRVCKYCLQEFNTEKKNRIACSLKCNADNFWKYNPKIIKSKLENRMGIEPISTL